MEGTNEFKAGYEAGFACAIKLLSGKYMELMGLENLVIAMPVEKKEECKPSEE